MRWLRRWNKVAQSDYRGKLFRRCFPLLIVFWVLLVLYPNPLKLSASLARVISPEVDPDAVASLSRSLPSDPAAIESAVEQTIPYSYDWETYGMPWYCPTVTEALDKGHGDCKARALVLASVLEAKDIPYTFICSPVHMWVDYEGKAETALENDEVKLYQNDPETGERSFRMPKVSVGYVAEMFWQGFWGPMPGARKAFLLCGLAGLTLLRLSYRKGAHETSGTLHRLALRVWPALGTLRR